MEQQTQSVSSFTLEELSQYNEAMKDKFSDKQKQLQ